MEATKGLLGLFYTRRPITLKLRMANRHVRPGAISNEYTYTLTHDEGPQSLFSSFCFLPPSFSKMGMGEVMFSSVFVCLSVCLFVCLFVCEQFYSKTTERICMKFGVCLQYAAGKKRLNFCGDLCHIHLFSAVQAFNTT